MIKLTSIRCIKFLTAPFFSNFNIGKHHCASRPSWLLKAIIALFNFEHSTVTVMLSYVKIWKKNGAVGHLMHLIDISLIIYSMNLKLEKKMSCFFNLIFSIFEEPVKCCNILKSKCSLWIITHMFNHVNICKHTIMNLVMKFPSICILDVFLWKRFITINQWRIQGGLWGL